MRSILDLTPCELATIPGAIALALAKQLTNDELIALGNLIVSTADIMLSIAEQRELNENHSK